MPANLIAKAIVTAVLIAGQYALQASRKIEGPRLDELGSSVGDYGVPIPDIWGKRRIQPAIFWAEDLREVKRRRKTKGGKYNDYTYYGTWAAACAAHEIEGITRIWFDTHLVYDMTGTGPVSPFDLGGGSISDYIAIYLGTMTQDPDERMQATVEAANGVGSCPAYHGIAYIVFKDVPLEKFGNRIPQVSVEVVSVASALWPYEDVTHNYSGGEFRFSPDYSLLYVSSYDGISIFDTASRTVINEITDNFTVLDDRVVPLNDGEFVTKSPGGGQEASYRDVYGGEAATEVPNGSWRYLSGAVDGDGVAHWAIQENGGDLWIDGAETAIDNSGANLFSDVDGALWVISKLSGTSVEIRYISGPLDGPSVLTVTGLSSSGGSSGDAIHYRDDTHDHFIFNWDGYIYAASRADGTIVYSYLTNIGNPVYENIISANNPTTMWAGFREISLADLTVVRELQPSTYWGVGTSINATVTYDPINHALVGDVSGATRWYYLDRIDGGAVTLGEIAANRAVKVGVEDYDFTALDQVIPGWSVTQGQASSQLEPLFDAYDSDIAPHEFEIIGKKRAGVSASTLLTENFVAAEPRYTAKIRQSAELPFAITYNFSDLNADQQPNNVRVARPQDAQAGRDERSIDMTTLANDADSMRGLAERHFRRLHGERREFELALTTQKIALEPGDVHTLDLDGDQLSARLLKTVISPAGVIETEWKYDHANFALLSGSNGAEMDGRPDSVVSVPIVSRGFFLDIPYITDSDARTPPSIYILAAPFAAGPWPGAVAYQAIDGEYSDEIGTVPSSSGATWGYANDVLADANPWLWDRLSSINVTLQNGTLTGCTEADIDADPDLNLILFGDELMNFTTATLEMDGTYTLSGFKRGRRGTEWACSTHALRDVVLLMDTAQAVNMGLSEVDTNLSFKMVTSGRSLGFPVDMEPYNGASLMPYAPVHLTATLSGSDWVFTWVRRTRVGGAWTGGASIPLSEASEEYELYLGDGVTTVTKTVTSATTYTWTAAQQTTDTGSAVTGGELTFSMAQVSDAVGPGFVAVY